MNLLKSVNDNNVERVKELLMNERINVNISDNHNFTALHHAVTNKNFEICQLLLNNKRVNPMIRSHEGLTALFLAIGTNASIEIIKLLVKKKPALVNVKNNEEIAPIHEAIKHRRLDVVKVLISAGANVNAYDLDLENSLHYAASNCDYEMIDYLLNKTEIDSSAKNRDEMNPLCLLIVRSRNETEDVVSSCFHLMLEHTFEKDHFSKTYSIADIFQPAFLATVYSHKEIVKYIIHNIYSVNNSKFEFIKQLFEAFEDSDNDGDEDDEELFYYLLVFLHDDINRFDKFNFPRFSEINYFMCVRSVMFVIQKLMISHKSVALAVELVSHLEMIGLHIARVREFEDNFGMILYNKFSKIHLNHQNHIDCAKTLLEFFMLKKIKINNVIRALLHSIAIAPETEANNLENMSSLLRLLFRFNATFFIDDDCWKQINEFKNLHDNIRQIVLWTNEQFGTLEVTCKILDVKIVYSLKHMCRNSIRRKFSHKLLAIDQLELPESLINYVLYIN